MPTSLPIVVLISGNGSNLQAILDAKLPVEIRAVISNKADAFGLQRAKNANLNTELIETEHYANREEFDAALAKLIQKYSPEYIVLAGFMRRLSPGFVQLFPNRIINIHPSLLPKYPGLHTYKKALAAEDEYHGVSIHFVTEVVDGGPIICQAKLKILANDTEKSLQARTQQLEHKLYPKVLAWLAEGRLKINNEHVLFDGHPAPLFDHNLTKITPD